MVAHAVEESILFPFNGKRQRLMLVSSINANMSKKYIATQVDQSADCYLVVGGCNFFFLYVLQRSTHCTSSIVISTQKERIRRQDEGILNHENQLIIFMHHDPRPSYILHIIYTLSLILMSCEVHVLLTTSFNY